MIDFLGPFIVVGAMLGVIIVARAVFGVLCRIEGYSLTQETVVNDNPAIGIRYALFLAAVVLSFSNIIHPSGISLAEDLNVLTQYGLLVISMLLVSRYVNDYLILYGFPNNREVFEEKNVAVAIVEGSTFLATAFVIAGALSGWEGGFWVALGWFGIGQILLIVITLLYRALVKGVFDGLDSHNHACALSLGGFLLSCGIALGRAINGPFHGWTEDLINVGIYMFGWVVSMAVAAFVANRIMLPSARLREEVMTERNVAAGVVEGAVFVAATLLYITVF